MYSVVLLAAMTATESAPEFLGRHHHGHHHHYGACYGACYGVGYTGWGGGCAGCWGAPYSGYCGYGAPYFPHLGPHAVPAHGFATPHYGTPVTTNPERNDGKKADDDKDTGKKNGNGNGNGKKDNKKDQDAPKIDDPSEEQTPTSSRARLIVSLPEGARLYVDDRPVAAARKKEFRTPALEQGETYFYDLRAEIVRDGKTVTKTSRVTITAGDVIKADFSSLGGQTGVAAAE